MLGSDCRPPRFVLLCITATNLTLVSPPSALLVISSGSMSVLQRPNRLSQFVVECRFLTVLVQTFCLWIIPKLSLKDKDWGIFGIVVFSLQKAMETFMLFMFYVDHKTSPKYGQNVKDTFFCEKFNKSCFVISRIENSC